MTGAIVIDHLTAVADYMLCYLSPGMTGAIVIDRLTAVADYMLCYLSPGYDRGYCYLPPHGG